MGDGATEAQGALQHSARGAMGMAKAMAGDTGTANDSI